MQPAVYILASKRNGTIYIGVTSDLIRRVWQHIHDEVDGFTARYHVHMLVYYETFTRMEDAIVREKRLKEWHRAWKIRLIEQVNPDWRDLWPEVCGKEEVAPEGGG
jgi:putative endonuclease